MDKKNLKKGAWAAGGVALLAVASALCVKGMKAVDKHLKAKKEATELEAEEAGLFEDFEVVEAKAAEDELTADEVVQEIVEATEEVVEAAEEIVAEIVEEEKQEI